MKKLLCICLLLGTAAIGQAQEKKEKGPEKPKAETEMAEKKEERKAMRKEKKALRKAETAQKDKAAIKGRRYYIDANGTKAYVDED